MRGLDVVKLGLRAVALSAVFAVLGFAPFAAKAAATTYTVDCSQIGVQATTWAMIGLDDLTFPVPAPYPLLGQCVLADFNGDGKLDLLNQTDAGDVVIFYQNKDGKYRQIDQRIAKNAFGLKWSAQNAVLIVEDVNRDGKADIQLSTKDAGGSDAILLADSAGKFSKVSQSWKSYAEYDSPSSEAVGASALGASVAPSGAASYSLPIVVPPGIAGMQPGLAISYNSQGGNGEMGVGWGLSGLSSISRCGKNMAVDGVFSSVNFDSSDQYCLDGQRLLLATGTHGSTGATYRTQVDSLSRITLASATDATGPDYFIVETKQGAKMYYGSTADSRIDAPGTAVPPSTVGKAITWALNKVEDKFGNYMLYSYNENTTSGEFLLKEIQYTGNATMGILPTRKVTISTDSTRTDTKAYFVGSSYFGASSRITRIKTYTHDRLVRNYRLTYESSPETKRTRIKNVQECSANECLQPIELTWQPGGAPFDALAIGGNVCATDNTTYGVCDPKKTWYPDLNGDGRADLCYLSDTGIKCFLGVVGGWNSTPAMDTTICAAGSGSYGQCNDGDNYDSIQFVDLDADGKMDLVYRSDKDGVKRFVTQLNNKGAMRFAEQTGVTKICYNDQNADYLRCDQGDNHPYVRYPDVNGDGYADLCVRGDQQGIVCYPGSATNWDINKPIKTGATCANGGTCNDADNYATIQYVDLNADGMADLVYRDDVNGVTRYVSTGTSFVLQGSNGLCANSGSGKSGEYGICNSWETHKTLQYPDINGDGYADLCYRGTQGIQCFLGKASGFDLTKRINTTICATDAADCDNADNYDTIQFADVDGDGRAELLYRANSGIKRWRFDGSTYVEETLVKTASGLTVCADSSTTFDGCDGATIKFLDITGDGRLDIVFSAPAGIRVIATGKDSPDLLKRIKTSKYGATVYEDLTYASLISFGRGINDQWDWGGNSFAILFGPNIAYPYRNIVLPTQVVAGRTTFDGQHAESFDYSYGSTTAMAVKNITGGAYVGVKFTSVTNKTRNTKIETTFNTDTTPFASMALPSIVEEFVGTYRVRKTQKGWKTKATVGGAKALYQSSTTVYASSLATSITSPNGYGVTDTSNTTTEVADTDVDAYGNVTKVTETVSLGSYWSKKITTLSEITNDTTRWCIGLPQKMEVTSNSSVPGQLTLTRTTRTAYDSVTCAVQSETIEPDSTTLWSKKTYGYDGFGNRNSVTITGATTVTPSATIPFAQRTSTTTFSYDGYFPEDVTNAKAHTEHRVFDAATGQLLTLTGPNGLTTRQIYDSFGRQVREERADGNWSQTNLAVCDATCLAGQAYYSVSSTAGAPNAFRFFDASGREVKSITTGQSGGDIWKVTQYSATTGERIGQTAPNFANGSTAQWGCVKLDTVGRTIGESLPTAGRTTCAGDITPYLATYRYEANAAYNSPASTVEKTTTRVDSKNVKTSIVRKETRNPLGQLMRVDEATTGDSTESTSTQYAYDAIGNLTRTIIGEGPSVTTPTTAITTNLGYNLLGQKTSMLDPDKGSWTYYYNVIGELIWQQDGMGYITTQSYDALGRLVQRVERGEDVNVAGYETTNLTYDTAANGIGSLAKEENLTTGFARTYSYDGYGRPTETINRVQNVDYSVLKGYDTYGRVSTTSYPDLNGARFVVANEYDGNGYLKSVKNNSTGEVYWTQTAAGVDASGHITNETLGSSLGVSRYFDPSTERLMSVMGGTLQDDSYVYDNLGNLESREDKKRARIETFTYDQLNRLKTGLVGGVATIYSYDILGNIKKKSDYGSTYLYGEYAAGPHAVTTVKNGSTVLATYQYDKNGNMTGGAGRTITYTSFGQPRSVSQGSTTLTFASYAADRSRVMQTTPTSTIIYVNPGRYELEITAAGTKHSHYLYGGSGMIGVHTRTSTSEEVNYFLKDHLGSIEVVTDKNGACIQRFAYDAFGKRTTMACNFAVTTEQPKARRGYTGHEMLESVSLVHMNGRLYDPVLGRMLQADRIIDGVTTSQGFNRYSYVSNNPLGFSDPTGYKKVWDQAWFKDVVVIAASVAIGSLSGGVLAPALSTWGSVIWNGFEITAAMGYTGGALAGLYGGTLITASMHLGSGSPEQRVQMGTQLAGLGQSALAGSGSGGFMTAMVVGERPEGTPDECVSVGGCSRTDPRVSPTWFEARKHYKESYGRTMYINVMTIDFTGLSNDGFAQDTERKPFTFPMFSNPRDFGVYGSVTIKNEGNGWFSVDPNKHNNDSKTSDGLSLRNSLTAVNRWLHGDGMPYDLVFVGMRGFDDLGRH